MRCNNLNGASLSIFLSLSLVRSQLTHPHLQDSILKDYTSGVTQVLVNVAVLMEGFDDPPTSCIVLLRPTSRKATMMQMIGRGLRVCPRDQYPGVIKNDCIVLDFGTAIKTHGYLEEEVCPVCTCLRPFPRLACWSIPSGRGTTLKAVISDPC